MLVRMNKRRPSTDLALAQLALAQCAPAWLADVSLCFVGKLGGLAKRAANQWVLDNGGRIVSLNDQRLEMIVLGAESFPFSLQSLDDDVLERIENRQVKLIEETEFWQRCELLDRAESLSQLYTPAMLADLLEVPVRQIRRWHRLGLIQPIKEVHRLPYFDFQEVASARRLVRWLGSASAEQIENKLVKLVGHLPGVQRPLSQLPIIVEGNLVLLRQMTGLMEPGGQTRFDFVHLDDEFEEDLVVPVYAFNPRLTSPELNVRLADSELQLAATPEQCLQEAIACEDAQDWQQAIEVYRSMMFAFGPTADVCFQIAELLYRQGDLTAARERYYMAVELDEDFVEALANLGCVLSELEQWELAVAAFEGALALHPDYADVLFHLASALDKLDRASEADGYWNQFLSLAPNSPWAQFARFRLEDLAENSSQSSES